MISPFSSSKTLMIGWELISEAMLLMREQHNFSVSLDRIWWRRNELVIRQKLVPDYAVNRPTRALIHDLQVSAESLILMQPRETNKSWWCFSSEIYSEVNINFTRHRHVT